MATISVTGTSSNVSVAPDSTNVSVVSEPVEITVAAAVVVGNSTIRNALNADAPISYDRIGGVMSFLDRDPVVRGSRVMDPALNPQYAGNLTGNISLDVENYDIWPISITGNVTGIALANVAVGQEVKIIFTQSSTPGRIDDTSGNYANWFWVNDNIYIPQTTGAKALLTVTWTGDQYIANMQEFGATGQIGIATGATAPTDPGEGWLWYDTVNDVLYVYASGVWEVAGGGGTNVEYGPTAPSSPDQGDLWFDTNVNYLKIWTGSTWISAAVGSIGYTGSQGATGAQGATGFTGSQGATGATGYTGSQGAQGPIGYTGSGATQDLANVLATGNTANQGADFGGTSIINLGGISFDGTETLQASASSLLFNNTIDTIRVTEEETILYKANVNIAEGDVLYAIDYDLNLPVCVKANTSIAGFTSDRIVGVATTSKTANSTGSACRSGRHVGQFGSSNFAKNEIVYLDVNTDGAMTNVAPVTPDPVIVLGRIGFPNLYLDVKIHEIVTPNLDQVLTAGNTSTQGMEVDQVTINANTTLFWDNIDNTLAFDLNANIDLNIGQSEVVYCKVTENINKGNVLMFAGVQGDHILASKANVDSAGFRAEYILGVADEDLITNDFTYAFSFGRVRNLNTSNFVAGDLLWVDPTTPGNLSNVEPSAPAEKILVAAVVSSHLNTGQIIVRISDTPFLNELDDVSITSPTNSQVIAYNASTGVWTNQNQTGGTGITYLEVLDGGAPGFKTGTSVFEADGGNATILAGDYIYDGGTA